jgi:serine/threonine-protein kinase
MMERTLSNRYKIENRIGSGGMATVYVGVDAVLRRRVAIKELRPQFAADEDFVKRFYTEAEHAAKLSHPNIVNIYDVGREGEVYFIVMELVDGTTLAEMIDSDGPLPEPVVIDYATQICAGLAYAHRQGLLHRDIKPANILVTKDDVVKLSDFGIARAVSTQTITVTQPGLVMGSVFYLSPEQAQGHDLGETSDLYSLGVVLYQMLTAKLPYTGDSPITVALKHVSSPIPSLDDGENDISPALAAIVYKLLQKDPAARFQSATEVASALREAREHPLITVPYDRTIPNPRPRPTRYPDRTRVVPPDDDEEEARPSHRFPIAIIAVVLIAAFIAGYVLFSHGGWFGPAAPVVVDDYVGRSIDDAEKSLVSAGLAYNVVPTASETIAKDHVIRQVPKPDATALPHSVVQLYVSSGLPNVGLIDLRQYSREDAERYLRNAKLIPKTTLRYDVKAPKGVVLSQSPAPQSQVPIRSVVSLVVSNGQQPVAVPDMVDLTIGDAQAAAQKRGLQLEIGERVNSDNIPADVVVAQNPPAGAHVDPNSKVTLTVSAGAPMVNVPDVGGKSVGDAMAAIQGSGLSARVTYDVDQTIPAGTVLQQDPAASSQAHKGSPVTLVVAVPGVVPEVTNMPLDQARAMLENSGYTVGAIFYGEGGQPGNVVRTDPDPNTPLRPGSSVALHVAGQSQ